MKRYTCTTCHRTVRVRRLPDDFNIVTKTATCRHHDSQLTRAAVNDRVRHHVGLGSTRKIGATTQRSKSKRG